MTTNNGHGTGADDEKMSSALVGLSGDLGDLRRRVDQVSREGESTAERVEALEGLGALLASLREDVERLAGQDGGERPRPWNWRSMQPETRRANVEELAHWVREVLLVGWPWVADRLRPCWPQHQELLEDLAALYAAYRTAYLWDGATAAHAFDFRRWLDDVTTSAEKIQKRCPAAPEDHPAPPVPRDDLPVVEVANRLAVLREVHQRYRESQDERRSANERGVAETRAKQLISDHGIGTEEYREFVERATRGPA